MNDFSLWYDGDGALVLTDITYNKEDRCEIREFPFL